jgi:hypothetical protein
MVATVRAQVNLDPALIVEYETGRKAAAAVLAGVLGLAVADVRPFADRDNATGRRMACFATARCFIKLYETGAVDILIRQPLGAAFQSRVERALNMTLGLLNSLRVRAVVAAQYDIVDEQRLPDGALVMEVSL